jgi:hypothetical protein
MVVDRQRSRKARLEKGQGRAQARADS